jgi:hypothetical protein
MKPLRRASLTVFLFADYEPIERPSISGDAGEKLEMFVLDLMLCLAIGWPVLQPQ